VAKKQYSSSQNSSSLNAKKYYIIKKVFDCFTSKTENLEFLHNKTGYNSEKLIEYRDRRLAYMVKSWDGNLLSSLCKM
jgi:hypothetical protein